MIGPLTTLSFPQLGHWGGPGLKFGYMGRDVFINRKCLSVFDDEGILSPYFIYLFFLWFVELVDQRLTT